MEFRPTQSGTRFRPEQGRLINALMSLAKLLERPVDSSDYRNLVERFRKTIVNELATGSDMSVAIMLLKELEKREADAAAFAQSIHAKPGAIVWHEILDWAMKAQAQYANAHSIFADEIRVKEQEIERLKRELAAAEERASRPQFKTFKTISARN